MGNHICCLTEGNHEEAIQLVPSDGTVQILRKPLCAAEILQDFPQHLVCHSDSFYIGQKTQTLSPNEQLKVGNKYFLLPPTLLSLSLISPFFGLISPPPPTKSPDASTACLAASLGSIENASVFCQPFEIRKSAVGGGLRTGVYPSLFQSLWKTEGLTLMNVGV